MTDDVKAIMTFGAVVAVGAFCVAYGISSSAWVAVGSALIVWPIATYVFAKTK